jgi:hypothetical protein
LNNGQDFWKYNADLSHAQRMDAKKMDLGFMDVLSNIRVMDKLFYVEPWQHQYQQKQNKNSTPPTAPPAGTNAIPHFDAPPPEAAGRLFVKFIPREDSGQKVLYAILQTDTAHIEDLRILWNNGNQMRLMFSHFSNQAPQENEFVFRPPTGIIVDDTRSK